MDIPPPPGKSEVNLSMGIAILKSSRYFPILVAPSNSTLFVENLENKAHVKPSTKIISLAKLLCQFSEIEE